jgi:tagaturonate reductase
MLLRALCAASVDAANRAGRFNGRIVVVQSTPHGAAPAINAQDGLFTLVERGLHNGSAVERTRLIGSISRALVADTEWDAVRDIAARPELQVIVSNVTEAGFRLEAAFPGRLTDLLYTRFERLPQGGGPPLFVIPTELLPDNGPRLAAMVDELATRRSRSEEFRAWLAREVRFCSSLVDRITTGTPPAPERAMLESRLGYADELLTVTEPYYLWAIKGDPHALRTAFAIDGDSPADGVLFAPDITFYETRKLRLLNGTHTALAPLAILAGLRTVREVVEHPLLGQLQRHILFQEIIPAADLPREAAEEFGRSIIERFRNPWLAHEWRVIATNQTAKLRIRVVPSILAYVQQRGRAPEGLALCIAAYLRWAQTNPAGDPDLPRTVEVPEVRDATTRWLRVLESDGVEAAVKRVLCT